jgi:type IV secretion system protein VirD4
VWATKADVDGGPTLADVVDLHKEMEGSESNPDEFTSETDLKMEAARSIIAQWQAEPAADDDASVMKMLEFATRQYRVYQQGPAETRLSVVISLGVRLAPLDMHDVRALLSADDIALDRIGAERTGAVPADPGFSRHVPIPCGDVLAEPVREEHLHRGPLAGWLAPRAGALLPR